MNDAELSKRLYRAILGVVLDDDLSADDMLRLTAILRRGRLSQAASEAIDVIAEGEGKSPRKNEGGGTKKEPQQGPRPSDSRRKAGQFLSSSEMFDLVKRRKVSKAQLLTIIKDIDDRAVPTDADEMTVRDIIQTFYLNSEPDDQNLLRKIVSGDFSGDPFLQGMSNR